MTGETTFDHNYAGASGGEDIASLPKESCRESVYNCASRVSHKHVRPSAAQFLTPCDVPGFGTVVTLHQVPNDVVAVPLGFRFCCLHISPHVSSGATIDQWVARMGTS